VYELPGSLGQGISLRVSGGVASLFIPEWSSIRGVICLQIFPRPGDSAASSFYPQHRLAGALGTSSITPIQLEYYIRIQSKSLSSYRSNIRFKHHCHLAGVLHANICSKYLSNNAGNSAANSFYPQHRLARALGTSSITPSNWSIA
jgi:hypothetical protein